MPSTSLFSTPSPHSSPRPSSKAKSAIPPSVPSPPHERRLREAHLPHRKGAYRLHFHQSDREKIGSCSAIPRRLRAARPQVLLQCPLDIRASALLSSRRHRHRQSHEGEGRQKQGRAPFTEADSTSVRRSISNTAPSSILPSSSTSSKTRLLAQLQGSQLAQGRDAAKVVLKEDSPLRRDRDRRKGRHGCGGKEVSLQF